MPISSIQLARLAAPLFGGAWKSRSSMVARRQGLYVLNKSIWMRRRSFRAQPTSVLSAAVLHLQSHRRGLASPKFCTPRIRGPSTSAATGWMPATPPRHCLPRMLRFLDRDFRRQATRPQKFGTSRVRLLARADSLHFHGDQQRRGPSGSPQPAR